MSWGVTATGRPAAVAAKLAVDFARCAEQCAAIPAEQEQVKALAAVVDQALKAYVGVQAVTVSASGSAYVAKDPDTGEVKDAYSTANLKIEPMWGFVE